LGKHGAALLKHFDKRVSPLLSVVILATVPVT
jgi:hypothetical protein